MWAASQLGVDLSTRTMLSNLETVSPTAMIISAAMLKVLELLAEWINSYFFGAKEEPCRHMHTSVLMISSVLGMVE